jgi:hypothetical protein
MRFGGPKRIPDRTQWHPWWAWRPVKTSTGVWAWCEDVRRRWNFDLNPWVHSGYSGTDGGWEYELFNDVETRG